MPEETFKYRLDLDTSSLQQQLQTIQTGVGTAINAGIGAVGAGGQLIGGAGYSAMSDLMNARNFIGVPSMPPPLSQVTQPIPQFQAPLYPEQRGFFGTAMAATGLPGTTPRNVYAAEYIGAARQDLGMRVGEGLFAGGMRGGAAAAGAVIGGMLTPFAPWIGGLAGAWAGDVIGQDIYNALSTAPQEQFLRSVAPAIGFGQGMNRNEIGEAARFMRQAGWQTDFTVPEVTGLVARGVRAGAFTGVQDVDEFKQVATEWLQAVRSTTRSLRVEADQAAEIVGSMRQMGVTDLGAIGGVTQMAGGMGRVFGQDPNVLMQHQIGMGQAARQLGLTAEAGIGGMQAMQTGMLGMAQRGALGAQQIADIGGIQGGAQALTTTGLQFLRTPFARAMAFAGPEAVSGFMGGTMGFEDVMGAATRRMGGARPGEAMIDFMMNERQTMGDIGAFGGLRMLRGAAEQQRQNAISAGIIGGGFDPATARAFFMSRAGGISPELAEAGEFLAGPQGIRQIAEDMVRAGTTMRSLEASERERFGNRFRRAVTGRFPGVDPSRFEAGMDPSVRQEVMNIYAERAGFLGARPTAVTQAVLETNVRNIRSTWSRNVVPTASALYELGETLGPTMAAAMAAGEGSPEYQSFEIMLAEMAQGDEDTPGAKFLRSVMCTWSLEKGIPYAAELLMENIDPEALTKIGQARFAQRIPELRAETLEASIEGMFGKLDMKKSFDRGTLGKQTIANLIRETQINSTKPDMVLNTENEITKFNNELAKMKGDSKFDQVMVTDLMDLSASAKDRGLMGGDLSKLADAYDVPTSKKETGNDLAEAAKALRKASAGFSSAMDLILNKIETQGSQ